MGEIIGPHDVILSPPLQTVTRHRIVEKTGIDLIVNVFAWVFCERRGIHALEAPVIVIPLLNDPWNPADFIFDSYNFQLRVAFQDSVENQLEESVGDIEQLEIDATAVALDAFSVLILVVAVSGQYVQADGCVEILRRRPELIVVTGME